MAQKVPDYCMVLRKEHSQDRVAIGVTKSWREYLRECSYILPPNYRRYARAASLAPHPNFILTGGRRTSVVSGLEFRLLDWRYRRRNASDTENAGRSIDRFRAATVIHYAAFFN